MTEIRPLDSQYRELHQKISLLDAAQDYTAINEDILSFVADMWDFTASLSRTIEDRCALQDAISVSALDDGAASSFRADQIAFYQQWIVEAGQGWSQQQARCKVGMTTKQILLLLRLGRDLMLLKDEQLRFYFEFVQINFSTATQGRLSYESLRKKYSQLDRKTLQDVRSILRKMLQQLDHYQTDI